MTGSRTARGSYALRGLDERALSAQERVLKRSARRRTLSRRQHRRKPAARSEIGVWSCARGKRKQGCCCCCCFFKFRQDCFLFEERRNAPPSPAGTSELSPASAVLDSCIRDFRDTEVLPTEAGQLPQHRPPAQ